MADSVASGSAGSRCGVDARRSGFARKSGVAAGTGTRSGAAAELRAATFWLPISGKHAVGFTRMLEQVDGVLRDEGVVGLGRKVAALGRSGAQGQDCRAAAPGPFLSM